MVFVNPRSVLHAVKPLGVGTVEVESLLSYFCRLAVSHSTSTLSLSRTIAERLEFDIEEQFDWHHRRLSGMDDAAAAWSGALSALTSIPHLDTLTFLPWREVIGKNGLQMVGPGQFCPMCLANDRSHGRTPYLRLAWELKAVTVCPIHKVHLRQHCPCCGQSDVRHRAAFVVPGWCTKCGAFLGDGLIARRYNDVSPITAVELSHANEVAALLSVQNRLDAPPQRESLLNAIRHIVQEMDAGQSARFAKRIGISKGTVHYWLQGNKTPTLNTSLRVASQSNISLTDLLRGNISGWTAPKTTQQLTLPLGKLEPRAYAPRRRIDWQEVETQINKLAQQPTPVSVREAARQLHLQPTQLYLNANAATRQLAVRWVAYTKRQRELNLQNALPHLHAAVHDILIDGKAPNLREVSARVDPQVLSSVHGLFGVLRDIQTSAEGPPPPPG